MSTERSNSTEPKLIFYGPPAPFGKGRRSKKRYKKLLAIARAQEARWQGHERKQLHARPLALEQPHL